jgi:hypothetical protein
MPETSADRRPYNECVRYYTTQPLTGGTKFQCIFCEHTVNTQDFDSAKGNRRTQAAAVINRHALDVHMKRLTPYGTMRIGGGL